MKSLHFGTALTVPCRQRPIISVFVLLFTFVVPLTMSGAQTSIMHAFSHQNYINNFFYIYIDILFVLVLFFTTNFAADVTRIQTLSLLVVKKKTTLCPFPHITKPSPPDWHREPSLTFRRHTFGSTSANSTPWVGPASRGLIYYTSKPPLISFSVPRQPNRTLYSHFLSLVPLLVHYY